MTNYPTYIIHVAINEKDLHNYPAHMWPKIIILLKSGYENNLWMLAPTSMPEPGFLPGRPGSCGFIQAADVVADMKTHMGGPFHTKTHSPARFPTRWPKKSGAYDKPSVLQNATTGCNLLPTCWIHVPKWSFKRNGQRSRYCRPQTPTSDEPSKSHRLRFASRSTQLNQEITRESHYSYRQPISLQPWSSLKTSRQTGTTKINKLINKFLQAMVEEINLFIYLYDGNIK
jgi:hypothetical protein